MYIYIYIYIYTNLPVNVIVRLPHPRLAPYADKQTRNYDTGAQTTIPPYQP